MNFLPSSSIVSVCRSKRSRGPPPASNAPSLVTCPTISTSLTFRNSGGGVARRGDGVAIRAKAPAHTSASRAAICAGRKLLTETATMTQSAKDAASPSPNERWIPASMSTTKFRMRMLRQPGRVGREVGLSSASVKVCAKEYNPEIDSSKIFKRNVYPRARRTTLSM